ncbi:hypothetical protein WJX74_010044 [Apatococcus lobatus]|uniref:J domain-containing protein n=1 Tax=Apatococcus lobatus TaxID=904363 RepID=A0AAW1QI87_9CHLO
MTEAAKPALGAFTSRLQVALPAECPTPKPELTQKGKRSFMRCLPSTPSSDLLPQLQQLFTDNQQGPSRGPNTPVISQSPSLPAPNGHAAAQVESPISAVSTTYTAVGPSTPSLTPGTSSGQHGTDPRGSPGARMPPSAASRRRPRSRSTASNLIRSCGSFQQMIMHGDSPPALGSPGPARDDSARRRHASPISFRSPNSRTSVPGTPQNEGTHLDLRQTSLTIRAHSRSPAPSGTGAALSTPVANHSESSHGGMRGCEKAPPEVYERFLPPGELMADADSAHRFEIQELQAVNRRLKQEIKLLKSSREKRTPELIKSASGRLQDQLLSQPENQSPNIMLDTGLMQSADSNWQTERPAEVMPACHVSVTPGTGSSQGGIEASADAEAKEQHAGHGNDVLELRTHLLAAQAHEQALASQNAQQQQHMQQLQEQLLTTGSHERELEQQLREQQEAAASEQLKVLALHSQRLQLNAELGARAQEANELRNQVYEVRNQAEAAQHSFQQLQAQCSFDMQATDRLQAQIFELQQCGTQLATELQTKQMLQEAHHRLCDQNRQLASDLQAACSAAEVQAACAAAHLQDVQSQLQTSRMREDQQVTGLMSELQAAQVEIRQLNTRLESRSPRSPKWRPPSPRQPTPTAAAMASIQASDSEQPPVSVIVRTLETGTSTPCKKCMQHAAADQDMNQRLEFILADRERLLADRAAAEAQLLAAEQALELQQVRHAEAFDQMKRSLEAAQSMAARTSQALSKAETNLNDATHQIKMLQEQLRIAGVASGMAHQGFSHTSSFSGGFNEPAGGPRWQYEWSNPAEEGGTPSSTARMKQNIFYKGRRPQRGPNRSDSASSQQAAGAASQPMYQQEEVEETVFCGETTEDGQWRQHWSTHYQQMIAGAFTLQERLLRLGVQGDLSTPAGLAASLRRAMREHPDKHSGKPACERQRVQERFKLLSAAYTEIKPLQEQEP